MAEVVATFFGAEGIKELADPIPQGSDRPLGGLSQQGFELGEELFDRVPPHWRLKGVG